MFISIEVIVYSYQYRAHLMIYICVVLFLTLFQYFRNTILFYRMLFHFLWNIISYYRDNISIYRITNSYYQSNISFHWNNINSFIRSSVSLYRNIIFVHWNSNSLKLFPPLSSTFRFMNKTIVLRGNSCSDCLIFLTILILSEIK